MENDIQTTLSQIREEFIIRLPDRLDILKTLLADIEPCRVRCAYLLAARLNSYTREGLSCEKPP